MRCNGERCRFNEAADRRGRSGPAEPAALVLRGLRGPAGQGSAQRDGTGAPAPAAAGHARSRPAARPRQRHRRPGAARGNPRRRPEHQGHRGHRQRRPCECPEGSVPGRLRLLREAGGRRHPAADRRPCRTPLRTGGGEPQPRAPGPVPVGRADHRRPRHAEGLPHGRARGPLRRHRAAARRQRHRQGSARARCIS